MDILYLIPARGGSKGIPKKNIKDLAGKPLVCYTIDAAREVANDKNICVSTDSFEIKEVVEDYGLEVPFVRPGEIATDTTTSESVIRHALNFYEEGGKTFNCLVLLQPTSPFRGGKHIKEALQLYGKDTEMVVSVKETESNPYYVHYEENNEGYLEKLFDVNYTRRQDCPIVWELNGAIYIVDVESFRRKAIKGLKDLTKIKKYTMNQVESIDIDTPIDWKLAEIIAKDF